MRRRTIAIARAVLVATTATLLVTCTDSKSPLVTEPPSFDVSDGATGGNVDVFFFPPLVSSPSGPNFGDRPSNPDLAPVAKVWLLNLAPTDCVVDPSSPPVASLPMTYNASGEQYQVGWQTSGAGLVDGANYRIKVCVGRLSLAYRDVTPQPSARGGTCLTTDPFCTFLNGSNLPIKVRIETAAVCIALDPNFDTSQPCATASLGTGESLSLSNLAIASVDQPATLNMKPCSDLRGRGLLDLRTFGECVDIDDVDFVPGVTLGATGTATLCSAFNAALAAGLTMEQAERMSVHRFSAGPPASLVALPHAQGGDCLSLPQAVGQAPDLNGLEKLLVLASRTWRAAVAQVREWLQPAPLWASTTVVCDLGGCGGTGGFESHYQVAQPAWMTFDPSNPGGNLGSQNTGTTVTGKVKVFDSGELPSPASPVPAVVSNARLTVATTTPGASVSAVTPCADPRSDLAIGEVNICSGLDGVATFTLTLGPGSNTVTVSGIGVGTEDGDGNPVNNVFAPSFNAGSTAPPVSLGTGTLTFTATGLVQLVFVPDPPTQDLVLNSSGSATLDDFSVCSNPRVAGVAITSLVAVTNNGSKKNLGKLPTLPVVTGADGCYLFTGVTINGTGAYRLLANDLYKSLKFNVRGK